MYKRNINRPRSKLNNLSWILIVVGISVCLYPFFTYVYAQYEQSKLQLEDPVVSLEDFEENIPVSGPENGGTELELDNTFEEPVPEQEPVIEQPKPDVVEPEPIKAMMLLEIPSINISVMVLKGTSQDVLAKGAGWYEQSALPGEGNTAIAAHNNIYGSWFRNVHKLKDGDEIIITYQNKKYVYIVDSVFPIATNDWSVIASTDSPALTLTTCYTKTQRLACRGYLKV